MDKGKVFLVLALAMLVGDLAMANLAMSAAYYLRFTVPIMPFSEFHPPEAYWGLALVESVVFVAIFAIRGQYRFRRNPSRLDELQRVFTGVSIGTVAAWAITAFLSRDFPYSRALMALAWPISVILIWIARIFQFWFHALLMRFGLAEERVLIIGSGETGLTILEKIHSASNWGYRPVGFLTEDAARCEDTVGGIPVMGSIENIGSVIQDHGISEIIIAAPSFSHRQIMDIVDECHQRNVSVRAFPDLFQMVSSAVAISDLNGLPMVSIRDAALRGWRLATKRVVDVVISSVALVCLSPLMLLIALIIKLTSPQGKVLFTQERVGLDGKPFHTLKFRSMRPNAETETGPVWARSGDPRVTPFGVFLRRFSLDELPQLVNVLLGEMSIVGPRPERPYFVEQFSQRIPRYFYRHREKAGLTGWAQVNGLRGNTSIEERTAYDLWYVENWTLWLDFKIMLRTLIAVFRESNG